MRTTLLVIGMVSFTVVANLLLKTAGAMGLAAGLPWWAQLYQWRTLAGFASFAAAAVFYMVVLRSLPLNVAQSFTAAQFLGIIVASALVLGEPIPPGRWVGFALIVAGILVVAWTRP